MYLPGDIKGLTDKLHLLLAEFLAGNTTIERTGLRVGCSVEIETADTQRVYGYQQSSSLSMIIYRRFAVRRYAYGGSEIVDTVGSLLSRYATKAMLATAAKAALRGGLDAAKSAVPHLLAHKLVTTIAKKRKKLEKAVAGSQ